MVGKRGSKVRYLGSSDPVGTDNLNGGAMFRKRGCTAGLEAFSHRNFFTFNHIPVGIFFFPI